MKQMSGSSRSWLVYAGVHRASFACRPLQSLIRLFLSAAFLFLLIPGAHSHAEGFLEPEKAFRFSAKMLDHDSIEVRYEVAPGYYLYRDRFAFNSPDAMLGAPVIPAGKVKFDETFQKEVETYRDQVTVHIPVQATGPFTLLATSQGCSDAGLCYSPTQSRIRLSPVALTGKVSNPEPGASVTGNAGTVGALLGSGKLLHILPVFLLMGLALAFTPCMLPMVPILSSIIVGDRGAASRKRSLLLSASYSLGMAVVYTALGVAAGLAGQGLSAWFQNGWVLGSFALVMVLLALAMFGLYELQMPAFIQARLLDASNRLSAGKPIGVFFMGALSALIIGPCVAAPLAGVLLYISQSRDAWVGGLALFAMATGMSVPLLLVGASAGSLLPRSGPWMDLVKRLFGVLMLGTALWLVAPFIPSPWSLLGWAALSLASAAWLFTRKASGLRVRALATLFLAAGTLQVVGLATGARDPLALLSVLLHGEIEAARFDQVRTVAELERRIASSDNKTVMLDFYADWCVSCKEMEQTAFSDPRVKDHLSKMVLLRADVTANSEDDRALLKRFGLFGPPGIIFFGADGAEIAHARVVGYQDQDKFLHSLSRLPASTPSL